MTQSNTPEVQNPPGNLDILSGIELPSENLLILLNRV